MLLPVKPICSRPRKDGSSVIFIQYCYSASNRTLLNTQLVIPPECWNKRRLCIDSSLPSSFGDAHDMNEALRKMIRTAEDLVMLAKQKKVHHYGRFVKEHFRLDIDVSQLGASPTHKNRLDVFYQLDEYIKSKSRKVTPGMIKVYLNMKALLLAFQEWTNQPITFDSFDFNFYEEFVSFLTFDYVQRRRKDRIVGLKVNSIGKTIKQLRIFLLNRAKRKIIPAIDLEDYTIMSEDSGAIYLNRQEITRLYNTDLSEHAHLIPYRDLFVLACLTGLRFSDFRAIRPEDIRKGMLYEKQDKSDH